FVGLEIKKNRFKKAISHAGRLGLKNIRFMHLDASIDLLQVFEKGSFSKVYINFPDPWPKLRHQK
ncbi:MAG: tRNA (guanosine(46)-N7)-methyltransferase TrmB, partial [Candidatus Dadabacteria bacterium]|nr:tRNA (guanosine(46)-N7)-methyltransferase TrmB [Candidatus Dadabacteria bacterium]NIV42648.1 tRNA (guanosine(46)-N7)-methyltransferase TrmB [Candidatus Dadabacteria bacterium]NIX16573.1 tRNA (guanosine(46)-N7)-methyltransferase TrmB [Candidatus Dadabacteria bacterium]